jgi:hypothetical protein
MIVNLGSLIDFIEVELPLAIFEDLWLELEGVV